MFGVYIGEGFVGKTVSVSAAFGEATQQKYSKMSSEVIERPDWIAEYELFQGKAQWDCQRGMSAQDLQEQKEKIDVVLSVRSYANMLSNPVLSAGVNRCVGDMAKLQGRKGLSAKEMEAISKTFECLTNLSCGFQTVQKDLSSLNLHLMVLRNVVDPHYHPELDEYL